MRSPTIASVSYVPGNPPNDAAEMRRFLFDELKKIATALALLAEGHVDTTYKAPDKPRDGDIRLADGVRWDPGSGAGFYGYYGAAWHRLG